MDNDWPDIIEIPSFDDGSEEPPPGIKISATADKLLHSCLGQVLFVQASVDATAILISDLMSLLEESDDKDALQKEIVEDYRRARRRDSARTLPRTPRTISA